MLKSKSKGYFFVKLMLKSKSKGYFFVKLMLKKVSQKAISLSS